MRARCLRVYHLDSGCGVASCKSVEPAQAESIIMDIDKKEADVLRRNALMQMLTERSILEEVESDRSLSETGMILQGRSLSSEDP